MPIVLFTIQLVAPHAVPVGYKAHLAALPAQEPVFPQLDAASALQSPSGSVPARTGPQLPLSWADCFSFAAQASHAPAQGKLQQAPSTQNPESQSPGATQAAPSGLAARASAGCSSATSSANT
jgi:hypothetical protein